MRRVWNLLLLFPAVVSADDNLSGNTVCETASHRPDDEMTYLLCQATAELEGYQTDGKQWQETRARVDETDRLEDSRQMQPVDHSVSQWSGFGEGFSSPANGAAIEVSLRAHTAPSLTEWNNSGLVVARIEVSPRSIEVSAGDPLPLDQLRVLTYDAQGKIVERAPLVFSLEASARILDFEGFRQRGTGVMTTGSGTAILWVESLLPSQFGSRLREPVHVTVHEPD